MNGFVKKYWAWFPAMIMFMTGLGLYPSAVQAQGLSKGQLVYVPIYSHVYYGDREGTILLTGILSVRNTDPRLAITLSQVDYYDSEGKLLRKYLPNPSPWGLWAPPGLSLKPRMPPAVQGPISWCGGKPKPRSMNRSWRG